MCNSVKKLMNQQQMQLVQKGPLTIGDKLPDFAKKAVVTTDKGIEIIDINQQYAMEQGKWTVLFWWPKDFTFVCPTEIIEFDKSSAAFAERNAVVIGASTDSEFVHLGWRQNHPGLAKLTIPMLADTSKSLAEEMGILDNNEKVAYRATFIIDPNGKIQWVSVYPMNVGRNVNEVLRVLDALQTEELTACGWTAGEQTLTAKLKEQNAG
ncbi:alkyl hydroperoxide reductase [Elizabethkingia anophelis]|nr:alkyl hydroperoxide reductase [Elizabethkingia anophelis]MDV3862931.1 alkyl hydroperoxide reductase [Elizabethkingia anophelis]MDV3908020.1 alkyl hydroperoxide reductase [Elizabethkingia anophelis]MDV3924448.1 alkyl hydroperoxide reductase [Elizabethkingia anophelis]MDV3990048.1 alkyl hydroperoxide reductase [Elizabethkingia anophelis]